MPAFGRRYSPDERDKNYPMRALLTVPPVLPRYKYWTPAPVLDQGNEGTCVGHGWAGWLGSNPIRTKNGPTAKQIYCLACGRDEWVENDNCDPYFGSSVRAGGEAMRAQGRVGSYNWAQEFQDTIEWLSLNGPVVAGMNWKTGMTLYIRTC